MDKTFLDVIAEGVLNRPGVRMRNATFAFSNGVTIDLDDDALLEFEATLRVMVHMKNVMEGAISRQHQSPAQTVDSESLRNLFAKANNKRESKKEDSDKSGE